MPIKHIFIINPISGKGTGKETVPKALESFKEQYDIEFYVTTGPGDATRFVRDFCAAHPDQEVRFYACGGDGTLNEVASGAVGQPHAAVSSFPCGSGNDYIRYYNDVDAFVDPDRLLNGTVTPVDIMQVGDRYAINAFHFGFDSFVADKIIEYRATKKNPYASAVLYAIVHGMHNQVKLALDDKPYYEGEFLICTVCNGSHVGGGYKTAPRSCNHDGLLEICLIRTMPRLKFVGLMSSYREGTHLDNPRTQKVIQYEQAGKVVVDVPKGFKVSLDGEVISQEHIEVVNIPGGVNFVVPRDVPIR